MDISRPTKWSTIKIATMEFSDYVSEVPDNHWWLLDSASGGITVESAWSKARGAGQVIGLVDTGINSAHLDFSSTKFGADPGEIPGTASNPHGTRVGGLIVGQIDNAIAGMGIAPDALINATIIDFSQPIGFDDLAAILETQATVDVSNNSWGFTKPFQDNFLLALPGTMQLALETGVREGRDGLGTVYVFAAGNGRLMRDGVNVGDDSNFHNLSNARQTIAVAATDMTGKAAVFSSPGTNLLVAAPGQGLLTADGLTPESTDSTRVTGTSFSAGLVSGAVALMLETNPDLGYRDVQEILVLSARARLDSIEPNESGPGSGANGANLVNGGGLVFSRDLGFGLLDTEAAIRLARTWQRRSDARNEAGIEIDFEAEPNHSQTDLSTMELTLDVGQEARDFHLQWVELFLSISGPSLHKLQIELVSPAGTISQIAPNLSGLGTRTGLSFNFSTAAHWGEKMQGNWHLRLSNLDPEANLTIQSARLGFFGDEAPRVEHYLTPSFIDLAAQDETRKHIVANPPSDDLESDARLNLSAMDRPVTIDLENGMGRIDTLDFTLSEGFKSLQGSDHGDTLVGGHADEFIFGGSGDDIIGGGGGHDVLAGGGGNNLFIWTDPTHSTWQARDLITDFSAGTDRIDLTGLHDNLSYTSHGFSGKAGEVWYNQSNGRLWVDLTGSGKANFGIELAAHLDLSEAEIILRDAVRGTPGKDSLIGTQADDVFMSSGASDTLTGGSGADEFVFASVSHSPWNARDTITDFTPSEDRIDLSAIHGDLAYVETGFSQQAGEVWYNPSSGRLWVDITGSGKANFGIDLGLGLALSADDIVL